jgi:hypothetical protein
MYRIWFALASAAVVVNPASAQNYNKNWVECAKELGWQPVPSATRKLSDGRTLTLSSPHSEAQQAAFNDCVARKASLAAKPGAKGQRGVLR